MDKFFKIKRSLAVKFQLQGKPSSENQDLLQVFQGLRDYLAKINQNLAEE